MNLKKSALANIVIQIFSYSIALVLQVTLMILLIANYGLEFNGFIRVNLILITFIASAESGIGIMAGISLFKPLQEKNWHKINAVLTTTHNQNRLLVKVGLGIMLIMILGYATFLYVSSDGIEIVRNGKPEPYRLYIWYIAIIIGLIASRNIFSMWFTGAKQNLIKADQKNYLLVLIDLIANLGVYAIVFTIITFKPNPVLPFIPFLLYSFVVNGLVAWYVRRNYPWLRITRHPRVLNKKMIKDSLYVSIKRAGYGILISSDTIIWSIILGLKIGSSLFFYIIIAIFIRSIMLALLISFQTFYGSLFARQGRMFWKDYRKIEYWTYALAAVAFINQFVSSPYLVNAFFGKVIDIGQFHQGQQLQLYKIIFTQPAFSLLMALITAITIITEPFNLFIYAKNKYRETAKHFLGFSILYLVLVIIFGIAFMVTQHLVAALYSILVIKIIVMLMQYGYLWVYNFWHLTYNSRFNSFLQNLIVFVVPVIVATLIVYLVLYPSNDLSYRTQSQFNNSSRVINWSVAKLSLMLLGVLASSLTLVGSIVSAQQLIFNRHHIWLWWVVYNQKHPNHWLAKVLPTTRYNQTLITKSNLAKPFSTVARKNKGETASHDWKKSS